MKLKFITVLSLAAVLFLGACGGKSDAELQTAATTAVRTKAPAAVVTVKNGIATLTGEVDNDAAKAAAEAAAKVEGVKSVVNNMTVKPAATPVIAPVADMTTKNAIEEALKKKGMNDVTVDATMNEVTLRGTVAKGKMAEVMQTATEIGKRKVNNQVVEK